MYDIKSIEGCAAFFDDLTEAYTKVLDYFPDGTFYSGKNGNYRQNRIYVGDQDYYIPRKNRAFAREICVKGDIEAQIADLRASSGICRELLNEIREFPKAAEQYRSDPFVAALLKEAYQIFQENGCFMTKAEQERYIRDGALKDEDNLRPGRLLPHQRFPQEVLTRLAPKSGYDDVVQEWLSKTYRKNMSHPEKLTCRTFDDEWMRSKLEVMTAEMFKMERVPYLYEIEHVFDGVSYFPDFTLMHPKYHYIIIWEVFGMMEKDAYAGMAGRKMQVYISHGFIPNYNLFCFCEKPDLPMDFSLMRKVLRHILQ